jgi:hypothetical protein
MDIVDSLELFKSLLLLPDGRGKLLPYHSYHDPLPHGFQSESGLPALSLAYEKEESLPEPDLAIRLDI